MGNQWRKAASQAVCVLDGMCAHLPFVACGQLCAASCICLTGMMGRHKNPQSLTKLAECAGFLAENKEAFSQIAAASSVVTSVVSITQDVLNFSLKHFCHICLIDWWQQHNGINLFDVVQDFGAIWRALMAQHWWR